MGDTFGCNCNCCCTDAQPDKLVNTIKRRNLVDQQIHFSKVLNESEASSTNTKSYNNDNQEYSITNDSSISETDENINTDENEQNIQYSNTENVTDENENENENSIIETEKKENDTAENVNRQQTILENIMNENKLVVENSISDNNDIDQDLNDKQTPLEIIDNKNIKIENTSDDNNDSDDMEAELAKLDNIKNYDNNNDNIIHMKIPNNIINNESHESNKSKNRLLLKKYKSEREMLDDESIENLLQMKLSNNVHVFKILGNQKLYDIPRKKSDRFHLERDLRKIKLGLKDFKICEQRKYAKIGILKHIELLTAVYIKYCKIGGDRHWLTYDGWITLLSDTKLIKMGDYNDKYFEIFKTTYDFHHKSKKHKSNSKGRHSTQLSGLYGDTSFHDKNPWTGVWCMEKDRHRINRIEKKKRENNKKKNQKISTSIKQKSEEHFDKYKLRKIGDLRIIGCMNNIEYGDIAGMTNKSNYRRAKLEIRFKKRRIKVHNQKRIWNCQIIPPKTMMDNIIMKVKWNEINQKSSKNKDGTFKLFKFDALNDNDIDLPISQSVGLARFEFFDAMLEVSKLLNENDKDLYETFNELCVEYLNEYCYKNIVSLVPYLINLNGKPIIREDIRIKMKGYNTILIKLFKKYAGLDNDGITTKNEQHLDCDEWTAMAVELCKAAKSSDKNVWKLGGRPSRNEIGHCFILCKDEDLIMDEEIDFLEFQRCLLFFTNTVFKYYPKARYEIIDFENKLHLVLKWCEKLESKKIGISSKSYHRSDTLKDIKRKKSMHQNAQSNQSSTPVDWNTISHSF